jgi:hypothetical protein
MEVTAYAATDLTNPLAPTLGTPNFPANAGRDLTVTYSNPGVRSAIYLRVRAFDEAWTGGYLLHVHRARGTSMADAMDLPNDKTDASALATFEQGLQPGSEQFKLWFHFKTEELWSGKPQWMTFHISQLKSADLANPAQAPDTPDGYFMQIVDSKSNIVSATANWLDQYKVIWDGTNIVPAAAGDYYLVVYRRYSPVKRPTAHIKASWATNLRTIDLQSLWNANQTGLGGEGHVWIDLVPNPYHFPVGYIAPHQTKGFPPPDALGNQAPLDIHHVNIADRIELEFKDPWDNLTPLSTIWAQGLPGKRQLDLFKGIFLLKYTLS